MLKSNPEFNVYNFTRNEQQVILLFVPDREHCINISKNLENELSDLSDLYLTIVEVHPFNANIPPDLQDAILQPLNTQSLYPHDGTWFQTSSSTSCFISESDLSI
ncbi:hypothetical protein RCL1_008788 [Eukaryota sp. TZLM3-RCL]